MLTFYTWVIGEIKTQVYFQELSDTVLVIEFDSPTPKVASMLVIEVILIYWLYSLIHPSKIFGVNHNFSVGLQGF